MDELSKVLIVEGKQDRKKVEQLLDEDILILCTFGTLGVHAIEEMIDDYDLYERDVYIFTDTDSSGEKLRKLLNRELSHAFNLHIDKKYRQVEDTPDHVLASILQAANIKVKIDYLKGTDYRE